MTTQEKTVYQNFKDILARYLDYQRHKIAEQLNYCQRIIYLYDSFYFRWKKPEQLLQ